MRGCTLRLARGGLALVVLLGLAAPAASLVTNPVLARGWGVALNNNNEKCSFVATVRFKIKFTRLSHNQRCSIIDTTHNLFEILNEDYSSC